MTIPISRATQFAASPVTPPATTTALSAPLSGEAAPPTFGFIKRRVAAPVAAALAGVLGLSTPASAEMPSFVHQSTAQAVPGIPYGVIPASQIVGFMQNAGNSLTPDGRLDARESHFIADFFQRETDKYGKMIRSDRSPSDNDYFLSQKVVMNHWTEFFRSLESDTGLGGPISINTADLVTALRETNQDDEGNITHADIDNRSVEIADTIRQMHANPGAYTMADWRYIHGQNTLNHALQRTGKYFNTLLADV